MARKNTATTVEAPKRPDFSLRMTDKNLYFGVEIFDNKLVVEGTDVSKIKTYEDLERYVSLISEVSERVEIEVDNNWTEDSCENDCTEGFCGPCYCAN